MAGQVSQWESYSLLLGAQPRSRRETAPTLNVVLVDIRSMGWSRREADSDKSGLCPVFTGGEGGR